MFPAESGVSHGSPRPGSRGPRPADPEVGRAAEIALRRVSAPPPLPGGPVLVHRDALEQIGIGGRRAPEDPAVSRPGDNPVDDCVATLDEHVPGARGVRLDSGEDVVAAGEVEGAPDVAVVGTRVELREAGSEQGALHEAAAVAFVVVPPLQRILRVGLQLPRQGGGAGQDRVVLVLGVGPGIGGMVGSAVLRDRAAGVGVAHGGAQRVGEVLAVDAGVGVRQRLGRRVAREQFPGQVGGERRGRGRGPGLVVGGDDRVESRGVVGRVGVGLLGSPQADQPEDHGEPGGGGLGQVLAPFGQEVLQQQAGGGRLEPGRVSLPGEGGRHEIRVGGGQGRPGVVARPPADRAARRRPPPMWSG